MGTTFIWVSDITHLAAPAPPYDIFCRIFENLLLTLQVTYILNSLIPILWITSSQYSSMFEDTVM